MTAKEIGALLSVYRPGETDGNDARFMELEKLLAADPALARQWDEEQAIDRAIGVQLEAASDAVALHARRATSIIPSPIIHRGWRRGALLAAAAVVALAVLFGSWRGPFQPAATLADYRDEMVGFIRVAPSLELETDNLASINQFLDQAGAPSRIKLPGGLEKLEPVGCRTLRFHGQNVTLICFRRGGGRFAHLFVVDHARLRAPALSQAQYATEGEWTSAVWTEGDRTYLLTAQGGPDSLAKYLTNS